MGRFTSVDPISDQFSELSTFNYASNNPAAKIDLHGLQGIYSNTGAAWLAEKQNPEIGKGLYKSATNYEKVSSAGTIAGGAIWAGAFAIAEYGLKTIVGYFAQEVVEAAIEETTGVPMINDIGDAVQNGAKRLAKESAEKGLGNQFKDKSVKEVNEAMQKHVKTGKLKEKYTSPESGSKSYKNTESGYSYNVDTGKNKTGQKVEPAHIDVNYPNPKPKNVPNKKKLPIKNRD
jgi:hypothetical protein